MRAARRSDPLLRDTLHWRRTRLWLWGWDIVAFLTLVILVVYGSSHGPSNSGPPALPLFIYVLSPVFVAAMTGLVFLPRAARKSGDQRLRRHLQWFGLFIFLALFRFVMIFIAGGLENVIPTVIANAIGGYCLYRSVRFLVPLNRISMGAGDDGKYFGRFFLHSLCSYSCDTFIFGFLGFQYSKGPLCCCRSNFSNNQSAFSTPYPLK
jgi:hypothetical protein